MQIRNGTQGTYIDAVRNVQGAFIWSKKLKGHLMDEVRNGPGGTCMDELRNSTGTRDTFIDAVRNSTGDTCMLMQ